MLVPTPKNCDISVKKAIQLLSTKLDFDASPTFVGLTLSGKVTAGSFGSPVDVTNTREYGFELHYSGNDYDVTGIRSRARLKTTDTTATAQGALLQAANEDGIDVGVLNGALIEAIGKSNANASTIAVMRGCLVNTEWGDYDTITALHGIHIRIHTRNNAGAGSFGNACALTIENEAVGGNGQAITSGIQFVGTNLSGSNKAFDYGINFGNGVEYGSADINLSKGEIHKEEVRFLKEDNTNKNIFFGTEAFNNDDGTENFGMGFEAGQNNDTTGGGGNGTQNLYIGFQSGQGDTAATNNTGQKNLGLGTKTLQANTTGQGNVGIGFSSLGNNTTGNFNLGIGFRTLIVNTTGDSNVAIGFEVLEQSNAGQNTAIGYKSLTRNTSGRTNTAIGHLTGQWNQSGQFNTIIGGFAGGGSAGSANSFSNNTCIGYAAGKEVTTGSDNIIIGYRSGQNQTTNSDRLIIDNQARGSAAAEITDCLIYGIFAATPANQTLTINAQTEVHGLVIQAVAKTGAYTLTAIDDFIECDASGGAFTITLPAVASTTTGKVYHIKKIDNSANVVTVDGNASETIDGGTTASITTQYECITIINSSSEWWIL